MKKFYAFLLSCVLLINGSFMTTVIAEEAEPQTEEPTQEVQPEEVIKEEESPITEETETNEEESEETGEASDEITAAETEAADVEIDTPAKETEVAETAEENPESASEVEVNMDADPEAVEKNEDSVSEETVDAANTAEEEIVEEQIVEEALSAEETEIIEETEELLSETEGDFEYNEENDGTACITGYTGSSTVVTIPQTLGGMVVRKIGSAAFQNNTGIKTVKISNNITAIDDYAFSGCTSLSNINLPSGIESVQDYTFEGCTSLTSIIIPTSVKYIDKGAFKDCTNLIYLNIPSSGLKIYSDAFYGCNKLTTLGETGSGANIELTIVNNTMSGHLLDSPGLWKTPLYASIKSFEVPASVKTIESGTFRYSGLRSITIPDNVTSLGWAVFENCSHLKSVTISDSVTDIGARLFIRCSALTDVKLPKGITSLNEMFQECKSLESFVVPDSVTDISGAFSGCTSLSDVTLPKGLKNTGAKTFWGCSSLEDLDFAGETIGANAFNYCKNLKTLTLDKKLTMVEAGAFHEVPGPLTVYFNGTPSDWKKISIDEDNDALVNATVIYVIPVSGVKLNKANLSLDKGKSSSLTATVSPADATNRKVTWTSSNTKVATVDGNGKVTAKGAGTATVTVKTADGNRTATCKVTVTVPVASVKLNKTGLTLEKGKTSVLSATVTPSDAQNKNVIWVSSDSKVAAVDANGKVTAKAPGTTAIMVITADGKKTATCNVTVKISATGVKLNKANLSLNKGKSAALTATVSPSDASNKKVTWKSSNTKVATVDSKGRVTAKGAGTATITVTTADGKKTATCKITVKEIKPAPTKDPAACTTNGFCLYNGKNYWFENGVRQGTVNDPNGVIGDGTVRGREIFDPATGAWYWLDAAYDGAKAVGKEVWMPYIYQDEKNWKNDTKRMNDTVNAINSYSEAGGPTSDMGEQVRKAIQKGTGKWVRYDENGRMMKGWVRINTPELIALYPGQKGNTYFYDYTTGLMAKGWTTIGGQRFFFDEMTGVLRQ